MSTAVEKANGSPVASRTEAQRPDPRAQAEAEAIRAKAQAEAEAVKIKARGEAEKQRLANEKQRLKLEREQADHDAYLARKRQQQEEADRAADAARKQAEESEQEEAEQAETQQKTARIWFGCALGFAIVCGIVALPVQMSAFYNEDALWLLAAPIFLEGGAWVVLQGARAAVEDNRPYWHYRLIAWALAFIAAGVNFKHGLDEFDVATAIGTAFASVAGPGVWDLHEHGRIRTREGKLSWSQRRAKKAAEKKAEVERKAAEQEAAAKKQLQEVRAAEREAYREKAAREAAEQLAKEREEEFPKVWKHARRLAAAMGETTVTESIWKRAHKDIEGTEPFESVDIIRTRNAAERRAAAARSEALGNTPSKVTNTQRTSQVPPSGKRRVYNPPTRRGVRRPGDTKFVSAARTQASIAAKNVATNGTEGS